MRLPGGPIGAGVPGAPPTMFAPPGSMYCGPPLGMAMPPQRPMTGGLGIMAVPPPLATPKPPLVPPPATEANAWREYTDTTGRAYYHDTRSCEQLLLGFDREAAR